MEINPSLERRIKFLLEAACFEEKRDQVITYTMRVLSNHATIGKDAGSMEIKKRNKLMSKRALDVLESNSIIFFCKNTINEHPKPLKEIWDWLKCNCEHLDTNDVWSEFLRNPMVTITRDEDNIIKKSGQNSAGDIVSRYTELGIEVTRLELEPVLHISPSTGQTV
jgi:hypothetical protein